MKQVIYTALGVGAIVAVTTLSGCSSKSNQQLSTVSELQAKQLAQQAAAEKAAGDTKAAATDAQMAADQYARIGELLLMPEGMVYANQMFDQALAVDPKNAKANFYKAWTGPLMQLKGFIPMIQPLVVSQQDNVALERFREDIGKLNMPEVQQFATTLPDGQKPFTKYYDIQRFIREKVLPSIQAAIVNISAVDTTVPLQLNFTPERLQLDPRRTTYYDNQYSSSCSYDPNNGWNCNNYNYNYSYDTPKRPNVYFVDQYDIKVLRSSLFALEATIKVGTAYSMDNIEIITRQLKAVDELRHQQGLSGPTAQDYVTVLNASQFADFLTLEKDQLLTTMSDGAAEALRNGIALANLRDKLCTNSNRNAKNSLIHPICIEADVVDALQVRLNALAGPTMVTLGNGPDGNRVQIEMDLAATLKNPPADIKALLPTTFDDNGNAVNYPDPTMSGLFPNGDLIEKLGDLAHSRHYSAVGAGLTSTVVRKAAKHL